MANRDIIVIGGSSGSVEVLLDLVPDLPTSFRASLFVVVHTPPGHASVLAEVLARRGPLPAMNPLHGDEVVPGRIYVAPADAHLLLRPGHVDVVRGPRENGHRPAVDALFRSASWAYGPRVVAVLLSGHQDCGTAGLMSVKARRGLAVVQDPATAAAPEMPRNALERLTVDHVVHPIELPGLLVRLAAQPAPAEPSSPLPEAVQELEGTRRGERADLVCPACQGVLTEARLGELEHFRCHVGHAFTLESLVHEQSEEVERALWAAVRSLEESARLSQRLATRTADREMQRRYVENGAAQLRQANVIRKVLLEGAAEFEGAEQPAQDQPGNGSPG